MWAIPERTSEHISDGVFSVTLMSTWVNTTDGSSTLNYSPAPFVSQLNFVRPCQFYTKDVYHYIIYRSLLQRGKIILRLPFSILRLAYF